MKPILILIVIIIVLMIVFFLLITRRNNDKDKEWLAADGDFDRARRVTGGDTPRDRLRTARIYLRTLPNDHRRRTTELDMQAARAIAGNEFYAALAAAPPLFILREMEDDLFAIQDALLASMTFTAKKDSVRQAASDVATGEITRNEYLDAAQQWVTDAENVHDSSLNNDLRRTLARAHQLSSRISPDSAFRSAAAAIDESDLTSARKSAAHATLAVIQKSEFNSTFSESEGEIFAIIWSRANIAGENAREAVLIALAECQREGGGIVCSNGRMTRIIDALNMTDPVFGSAPALTTKAYRDQVFAEVQSTLKEHIAAARDAGNHTVADAYEGKAMCDETTPEYQEFRKKLAASIDEIVDRYASHFSQTALISLREDCRVVL